MSRHCGLILLALGMLAARAQAQTVVAAVECRGGRLNVAESEICASPELRQLNNAIDELTARIEAGLSGDEKDALLDTRVPFITQRNSCQNERSAVRECVQRVVRGRSDALTKALTSPSSILEEISRYEFVGIAFFQKYAERLVGRRIRVFGCMSLAPGPTPAQRTKGFVRESCTKASSQEVPVVFRSMTATATYFYDAKEPTSYWTGIVERRDGRMVLSQVEP